MSAAVAYASEYTALLEPQTTGRGRMEMGGWILLSIPRDLGEGFTKYSAMDI